MSVLTRKKSLTGRPAVCTATALRAAMKPLPSRASPYLATRRGLRLGLVKQAKNNQIICLVYPHPTSFPSVRLVESFEPPKQHQPTERTTRFAE